MKTMVYLVTGHRIHDGWPFAGEVAARDGRDAVATVRAWGVEAEYVQELASGRVELFREPDPEGDSNGDANGDAAATEPGVTQ